MDLHLVKIPAHDTNTYFELVQTNLPGGQECPVKELCMPHG